MSEKKIIIAIDGFASCGKSTIAKGLAKKLEYAYLDTGAMYRAVTYYVLKKNISPLDDRGIVSVLPELSIQFKFNGERLCSETYLNHENIEDQIRSIEVSNAVSHVSRIKEVREKMVHLQQEMGKEKGFVLDGRDIGTVVFPMAELKLFIIANIETRVERRYRELTEKGTATTREVIMKNLTERDYIDTHRDISPLRKADDAIELDTTFLTTDQQLKICYDLARRKMGGTVSSSQ